MTHSDADGTERAELRAWLLERGFTAERIDSSLAPLTLPAERLLGDDGRRVSAREICRTHDIEPELLVRLQRAVGLPRVDDPDARVHLPADGAVAAQALSFLDIGFDEEQVVAVSRVLADGLGRAAELMRFYGFDVALTAGASEIELAQAYEALVENVAPLLGPLITDMLALKLRHSVETEAVNAAERASGTPPGAREVAVAFADLVGFTRLGESLPPEEVEQVADRLTGYARDVATDPVRLVKTIGDAVMFVGADAAAMLDTMLELLEVTETDDDFPSLRIGVSFGSAVSRAGDWFGSPVNVASRVCALARPGAVLATAAVQDAVGDVDRFRWSFAGKRHLKGVSGEMATFRVRGVPGGDRTDTDDAGTDRTGDDGGD